MHCRRAAALAEATGPRVVETAGSCGASVAPQLARVLLVASLTDQEIKPTRCRISLNLPVPERPVALQKPLPEPVIPTTGQTFDC